MWSSDGLNLAVWPADAATGLSPLDTYSRLGLNTAGGAVSEGIPNHDGGGDAAAAAATLSPPGFAPWRC